MGLQPPSHMWLQPHIGLSQNYGLRPLALETRRCVTYWLTGWLAQGLYFAARESYVSTLIVVAGYIAFAQGIIFIVGQVGELSVGGIADGEPAWAASTLQASMIVLAFNAPFVALLAAYHLSRKAYQLLSILSALRRQRRNPTSSPEARAALRMVGHIGLTQLLIALIRIVAVYAIAASGYLNGLAAFDTVLNGSVDLSFFMVSFDVGGRVQLSLPLALAVSSIGLQIIAFVFRFLVEYCLLYSIDTRLGALVCSAFVDELNTMATSLAPSKPSTVTKQAHARVTWQYVARTFAHKYRFDTIFLADRFGSIFHYIQAGLEAGSAGVVDDSRPQTQPSFAISTSTAYSGPGVTELQIVAEEEESTNGLSEHIQLAQKTLADSGSGELAEGQVKAYQFAHILRAKRHAAHQVELGRRLNTQVSFTPHQLAGFI